MLTINVAVVPFDDGIVEEPDRLRDLLHVTSALQVQLVRDLGPAWGVSATIAPFARLEDVPPGYWPLALVDDLPLRRRGLHFASGGRPFALVKKGPDWSRMASHELLELVCDPWGNRTVAGRSLRDVEGGPSFEDQGQVEYLVEVCDPCQALTYTINGVLMSDFVTPHYYEPLMTGGARYSFTGSVGGPRSVLDGGYLTWRDPVAGEIWQAFAHDGETTFVKLSGDHLPSDVSIREWVDDFPTHPALPQDLDPEQPPLRDARAAYRLAERSADNYGSALRRDIIRVFEDMDHEQSRIVKLSSQESDAVVGLIRDLGTDRDVRTRFQADPQLELLRRGIAVRGVLPPPDTPLPEPETFLRTYEALRIGNRFGDTADIPFGPFWWLGVLGGG